MKDKQLKITHIPLHCPICKERFMNLFGQPLPNHAQIRCTTERGDEMDLGICANCVKQGVSMEMVAGVLEGIKDYWVQDIDNNKSLKADTKAARKAHHTSHQIKSITKVIRTGKRAEKEARAKGKLL